MKINFNNKEIEFKFKFRAELLFEDKRGYSFMGRSTTDWLWFFYCYYIALTDDHDLSYDECEELLDENPRIIFDFITWYSEYWANNMQFVSIKTNEETDKEKDVVSEVKKR